MIYLDHHAATPLSPEAEEAMTAAREVGWANPESLHAAGRAARALRERARERVANAVGATPAEIVFTSGGTEAVTLGVLGLGLGLGAAVRRVVTTRIEHPSVARAVDALASRNIEIQRRETPSGQAPDIDLASLDEHTLVAMAWVNHETGTCFDVRRIAADARSRGARVLIDATQALGKLPLDVAGLDGAVVALAAHKAGGPAGAGALVVSRGVTLAPVLYGGGQERGRRPGSPNVVTLTGFGAACLVLPARLGAMDSIGPRRDRLEAGLVALGAVVNGAGGPRVATCSNVSFEARRGDLLVAALDLEGVCISSGAACSSGVAEPSQVLLSMYPEAPWRAHSALRFTLGPETSDADIDGALEAMRRVLERANQGFK